MADTSAITAIGQGVQQQNPLGIVQGYQNLANSVLQNKIGQQSLETQKQALATTRSNQMAQRLYAVNALPDDQVAGQAQRILDDALQGGTIDQNHYAIGQKIIQSGNVGNIRQYATLGLIGTLSGPEAVNRIVGQPYIMNNGQSLQPGMIGGQLSQNPGAFTPAGGKTDVYPSRSELLTQQPGVDSETGAPTTTPLVVRAGEQGQGGLTGPAGVNTGNASPTNQPRLPGAVPPASGGNGATGAPASGGTAPPAPEGAPAPTGKPGAVVTGLPPGSEIPMRQSAQQYADDRTNAASFATRTYPLQAAISLYNQGTSTGPGADWINNVKSFLLSRASNFGWEPNKIATANFDELQKYLTQNATANPMAAGSDARLATALTGNPSTHISTLAGKNVSIAAMALERMRLAATQSYNGTPQGYSAYMSNYATHSDPRAFAVDYMTPEQQQAMLKGMKPAELTQFKKSYELAKSLNLLTSTAMPANQ